MAHRQVFSAMGFLAAAAAEIAVCPGESDRYGDFKCNHDPTHRVCATLLDSSGKPLAWGSNGTFWEITGQSAFQWDDRIRANHGDSWCICMWATARLIETVGCENIHLNCAATDVAYVENSYQDSGVSLAAAKSCLERKCPKQSLPQELDDASLAAAVPGSTPQHSMANWMPSSFLPLKLGGVLVALIAGVAMYVRSPGRQDTQLREVELERAL
ncbi:unnamed protein product [Symbiodinium sp. CCMP2592]|nr:unnamed protein product [Symbiodinium sp. CCMP2592]